MCLREIETVITRHDTLSLRLIRKCIYYTEIYFRAEFEVNLGGKNIITFGESKKKQKAIKRTKSVR